MMGIEEKVSDMVTRWIVAMMQEDVDDEDGQLVCV